MNFDPLDITPEEFELTVKSLLESTGPTLVGFESRHREKLKGSDGVYEIDITVRFEVLGVQYTTLVECKKHKNPIKREVVQVLHKRLESTGAHKGILAATTSFQRSALEYATVHGIALLEVRDGKTSYVTKSMSPVREAPPRLNCPNYVGWLISLTEQGKESRALVSPDHPEDLKHFLFGE